MREVSRSRRMLSLLTAIGVAVPAAAAGPAPGTLEGSVRLHGRPLAHLQLALVDFGSGAVHHVQTTAGGTYRIVVAPGQYLLAPEGATGVTVGQGPLAVTVNPGAVAAANLDLVSVASAVLQQPPAAPVAGAPPAAKTAINHEFIDCVVAGQPPLIDAVIEPAASVTQARVYFQAGDSPLYYVEMKPAEVGYAGALPRPKLESGFILYSLQAVTTQGGEAKTKDHKAIVVNEARECPDGGRIAMNAPPGDVTVFEAATGRATAPAGFAAGGLALTAGTLALLAGGASVVGISAAVDVFNPSTPTPPPTAEPTPVPSPSPVVADSPTPPPPPPTPPPSPSPSPTPETSPTPVPCATCVR